MLYINNVFNFSMLPEGILQRAYFLEFKDLESAKRFVKGREYKSLVTSSVLAAEFGVPRYGDRKSDFQLTYGDEMLVILWLPDRKRYIHVIIEEK